MGVQNVEKVVIDNKTMDVITPEALQRLIKLDNPITSGTVVKMGDYVYPITKKVNYDTPSVSAVEGIELFVHPKTDEDKEKYSVKNIISLGCENITSLKESIEAMDKLKSLETTRLAIVNDVLNLPIREADLPELVAVKEAINAKEIDTDSYKGKFSSDSDYNNDMRALKSSNTITFLKAKRILEAFDIDMYITLKDKPDAVNPMGTEITMKLTGD